MKAFRKVIPAMALLLISAVILSTASYAWFTMSKQVTASGMNVTVTAPNNLLIDAATSGDGWSEKQELTATNISLVPASSISGADGSFFKLKDGSVATSSTGALIANTSEVDAGTAATDGTAGAYYDFAYKVKTEGTETVGVALKTLTIANHAGNTKEIKPVRVVILTNAATTDADELEKIYAAANVDSTYTKNTVAVKAAGVIGESSRGAVTYEEFPNDEATPAAIFNVPTATEVTVTIRVWFEGEDPTCTAAAAASAAFDVTAIFTAVTAIA